jgi:hypothetical protein
MLEALKLILVGFENLTELKINYAKSEIISLNISEQESIEIAQLYGCKISKFLIKYLGFLYIRKN